MMEWLKKLKLDMDWLRIVCIPMLLILSIGFSNMKFINEIQEDKYKITTNAAEEYFYNAEYDKAITEYKNIMEKDKDKNNIPQWNLKIAEVYSVKGDLDNSRKYIDEAKKTLTESSNSEIYNYICFTEFMNKDYKEANIDGEAALIKFSNDKKLIKTMFTVYMANNELDKASKLLSSYPYDKNSAYDIAEYSRMLMIIGMKDEGYSKLRQAWGIDKDEYKIYDVLAQTAIYNRDDLLQDISNLSSKNPEDDSYKMWMAKIYSSNSDTSEQANDIINSIKSSDVGKIEINLIQASVLQNMNQNDKSDVILDELIKKYPDDYRVLHTAGWYYLNKKEYTKALEYCKKSIVKNKDYPDNYGFLMPEILKGQNKSIEGEPYFRTAMFKEPYNYNIMLNIANFYGYTAKNSAKAMEYFKFAEIIRPKDPEIKYNIALLYLSDKKESEAINILKQCIAINDPNPKYHRTLGTIYLSSGKSEEAIKEIRYAYHADEQDILTLNNAGCYYITVEGNLQRSLFNFQKAAEGINSSTDSYYKDNIKSNYEKIKKLYNDYGNGKADETLKIPDFTLFY